MNSITRAFVESTNYVAYDAAKDIHKAAQKQSKFKEGWSFSGSYKTFQALKAQGKLS